MIGKALDGNASDNTVFKERSEQLIESFKASEPPSYLIADCKLYTEKNAPNLKQLQFMTRIPNAITQVGKTIDKALETSSDWQILDDGRRLQVLSSETSKQRAVKQVDKKVSKEATSIEKQLFHLQAQRFNCAEDARFTAKKLAKKWKFHHLTGMEAVKHLQYEGKDRPKKGQLPSAITYQLIGQCGQDSEKIERAKIKGAHYIIGSNIAPKELSDQEIIHAYKEQHQVERGFRFLKDPLFFTSSLFVKKTRRIMALLMVMLLSLLVYSIAERRMRTRLKEQKETLPNQINRQKDQLYAGYFSYYMAFIALKSLLKRAGSKLLKGLRLCEKRYCVFLEKM